MLSQAPRKGLLILGLRIVHLLSKMKEISTVFDHLSPSDPIVITMHQKPDPDAMGSALGLYHFFKKQGYPVKVISPTNWLIFSNGCQDVQMSLILSQKATHLRITFLAPNGCFVWEKGTD